MKNNINILFAASEAAPMAKEGGLGDVAGSLPRAFRKLGCKIAVIIPAYRKTLNYFKNPRAIAENLPINMDVRSLTADILECRLAPGLPLYLVRKDEYFDRSGLYGNERGEYFDNTERFIFFSKSVAKFCTMMETPPDILFCNDWQTGLVMPMMIENNMDSTTRIFAIHNMGYLGLVPREMIGGIGLPAKYYGMDGIEYYGNMSLLKAGIQYSDVVTTVSPTYAREIQTPEYGSGLDGLMRSVSDKIYGILNGVDYGIWNPAGDKLITENYSRKNIAGKRICKQDLLEITRLDKGSVDRPLLGMISRLVDQKGIDLFIRAAQRLFNLDLGVIILGRGEKRYHKRLIKLRDRHPEHFSLNLDFNDELAHKILAGCDMLLVPSRYEPCGLTQMYGMKYGTIPIVRSTGGLRDTVIDPEEGSDICTGFKFIEYNPNDMVRAIKRALKAFNNKKQWNAMMKAGMSMDFSWHRSANEYINLFRKENMIP
ncbi:MAG: glycogen synthase GlgA [Deltaproteobacteria bacterium]|nr:glycogen synthase GlgA [Deltaproteobacteria bacterium]